MIHKPYSYITLNGSYIYAKKNELVLLHLKTLINLKLTQNFLGKCLTINDQSYHADGFLT